MDSPDTSSARPDRSPVEARLEPSGALNWQLADRQRPAISRRIALGLLIRAYRLQFGDAAMADVQTLAGKVVEDYENASMAVKRPGGSCYGVVYRRVQVGAKAQCKKSLPSLKAFRQFDRLWGSKYLPRKSWLKFSADHRAKGPAGAMAAEGWGTLVEQAEIWSGHLVPGAVIQVWKTEADYVAVLAGKKLLRFGHAFIFRKYKNSDVPAEGMIVADQGFLTRENLDQVIVATDFARWFAANIKCPE